MASRTLTAAFAWGAGFVGVELAFGVPVVAEPLALMGAMRSLSRPNAQSSRKQLRECHAGVTAHSRAHGHGDVTMLVSVQPPSSGTCSSYGPIREANVFK
jgi:hypothetical protein